MSEDPSRTRESYDEIAATYTERMFTELAGKPLDRHLLNRFAEDVGARGRVADLGCGPGHVARYLHEQGVRMLGIDLSPRMIDWARKRSPEIEFRVGDMRALELADGALAGIVAFYSLIHIDEAEMGSTLRELRRVLAPGGLLLVAFHIGEETVHRDELWGHAVSLDFRFLMPPRMVAHLDGGGLSRHGACRAGAVPGGRASQSPLLSPRPITRGSVAPGPRRRAPRTPRGGSARGRAG